MTNAGTLGQSGRLPGPQRRRQLISAAVEVFGDVGYHKASMADIASQAGITKPVLYQHFDSKTDLFRAAVQETGQRMREAIARATSTTTKPREQVELGIRAYVQFIDHDPAAFRTLFSDASRADPELAAEVHDVEAAIAAEIAELMNIAGVTDAERRVLAHALVGMAEGGSRYWDAHRRPIEPDTLASLLAEFAWAGLRGDHPR